MSVGSKAEIAVGGAVLAAALLFLVYAGQIIGFGDRANSYELRASFRSVEGIRIGTDVRIAGVKVGAVSGLAFNSTTFMADARFTLQEGIELPDDSTAVIASEGLLGGNYLEIMPGGSPFNLAPGGEIADTQGAVSLTGLLMKFVGGAAEDALKGAE